MRCTERHQRQRREMAATATQGSESRLRDGCLSRHCGGPERGDSVAIHAFTDDAADRMLQTQ